MRVGVVGAGISGLVCAQRLLQLAPQQQLKVTTLEWGRGPGGRTARRRVKINVNEADNSSDSNNNNNNNNSQRQQTVVEASFDHAAPFFTARTNKFREGLLSDWEAQGLAAPWITAAVATPQQSSSEQGQKEDVKNDQELWVGLPSNHAIAKGIVQEIQASQGGICLFGQHVQHAEYDKTKKVWNVRVFDRNAPTDAVKTHTFDALVLSDKLLILPNTYSIVDPVEWESLAIPSDLGSTGAVVLLVAFHKTPSSATSPPTTKKGVLQMLNQHPFLQTVVHESTKPGRDTQQQLLDLWVVHSTHKYAASHLVGEKLDDVEAVQQELLNAFLEVLIVKEKATTIAELTSRIAYASVMAWDHAQPNESKRLEVSHLLDSSRKAGVCGDFFLKAPASSLGPCGVEAAALSGLALAENLAPLIR